MRSIPLLAATSVILAAAWSCGGGGTGVNVPVANFTVGSCTSGSACQFTNTSTPSSGLNYSWNFGDGSAKVTDQSPAHTFTAARSYPVALTVTDASSATNTKTTNVTVAAGTNQPPTASFDAPTCTGGNCSFHSTSTDVDGTIASYLWDFGDPASASNSATTADAAHAYNVTTATDFNVTLTVTDDKGATATSTQKITITPASRVQCPAGSGKTMGCTIVLDKKSTVKITFTDRKCELHNNMLLVTSPIQQDIFLNGCSVQIGTVYTLNGPNADQSFNPGAIQLAFTRGEPGLTDPPASTPAAKVSGSFPQWTLAIDDGGNFGGVGEPNYTDLILTIDVTVVP